uniref:Uncharacterized protein n=1 Tax=Romanomermis culicivorax TaxID=13658 RepID=A0A915L616_ROMCU
MSSITTPKMKRNLKAVENLNLKSCQQEQLLTDDRNVGDDDDFRKPADVSSITKNFNDEKFSATDVGGIDEKQIPPPKATPAIKKAKQFKNFFQSPTDALMSPFTRSFGAGKSNFQHPALLKPKRRLDESAPAEK